MKGRHILRGPRMICRWLSKIFRGGGGGEPATYCKTVRTASFVCL